MATKEQSIKWMLAEHPNEVLWLLTKQESLKENSSRPVGCWLIGALAPMHPKVGEPLIMARYANQDSPEGKWGMFISTKVESVKNTLDGIEVRTENSVYHLRQLNSVMDVLNYQCEQAKFNPYERSE